MASDESMKILYVITSLRLGGAERIVTDLAKGLSKVGHTAEIFVMDSTETPLTKELQKVGIKIHKGWKGYFNMWNPFCLFKLKSVIKTGDYDIIHSHNSSAQYLVPFFSKKAKLVTTEHTPVNRRHFLPIFKKLDSLLYSKYKNIVAVSQSTKNSLLTRIPLNEMKEKTEVIYNGIVLDNFKNKRESYSKLKTEKIIIMVAGFHYPKDQTTLIKAMTLLPPEYKLWLVGDGISRKDAQKLAEQTGVYSRIKFWGFRNDVRDLLKKSDIFVLSSRYEGFGIAVIEAMSTGLPVIVSDVEGLTEIVSDAGILFNPGDERDLAMKIKNITRDEYYYMNVAKKCKERSKIFDINNVICQHISLYSNLSEINRSRKN